MNPDTVKNRLFEYKARSIIAEEPMPKAAVLVPLRQNGLGLEIVLTLRAGHLNTHKGQVAFPGGKCDETDETLMATALRESEEEIALPSSAVRVLGQLSEVISLHGILVTPYVGMIDSDVTLVPNPDELDSIFYVDVETILKLEPKRRDRMTYKGIALSVPSYDYEYKGRTYEIWGLSAIILVELLNCVFDADITIFDEYEKTRDKNNE